MPPAENHVVNTDSVFDQPRALLDYRAGDGEDAATGSHRWFLHGIFG